MGITFRTVIARVREFTGADARRVRSVVSMSGVSWVFVVGALVGLSAAAVGSPFAMGKGILPATLLCAGLVCWGYVYAKRRIKRAVEDGHTYDAARFGFAFDLAPVIVVFAMFVPRLTIAGEWTYLVATCVAFAVVMVIAFVVGPWRKVAKLSPEQLRDIIRDPKTARQIEFRG